MGGVRKRRSGKTREERKGAKECPSWGIVFGYRSSRERRAWLCWEVETHRGGGVTRWLGETRSGSAMWGWDAIDSSGSQEEGKQHVDVSSFKFLAFWKTLLLWNWIANWTSWWEFDWPLLLKSICVVSSSVPECLVDILVDRLDILIWHLTQLRMSRAGDVVCEGWLRKSPPEKKLRRYVSNISYKNIATAHHVSGILSWEFSKLNSEVFCVCVCVSSLLT